MADKDILPIDELMFSGKWEAEEKTIVRSYLDASIQIVKNAGAFDKNSKILPLVLSSMVMYLMEHRGEATDAQSVASFPLSIQALVNSIKYSIGESDE
ncbi:hypothetical protein I6N96_01050 [Enterococcus sp. BWM-S5]|uniref:Phage gp6-like head-tail connector protein n=1 Tax=Enterococcus larvae TaxID=2794352 RepID=A0ABS4CE35_9ENTE|nr:hypothetical protein [Enterococcus larvae]MBP1044849.1 hypothetical protein [Enterococcus larvae]